jgi:hypothetical protein
MDDLARTHLRTLTREIARRRDALINNGLSDPENYRLVYLLDRIVVTAGNGTVSVRIDTPLNRRQASSAKGLLHAVLDSVEGTVTERPGMRLDLKY